jgi:hypothetical protein
MNLEKNPLSPAVVVGIRGGKFATPVVAEAKHFELTTERVDVFFSLDPRMYSLLSGEFFCRQSEGVPAHRVQHIHAFHPRISTDDVRGCVALRMSHVKSFAGWIGNMSST